MIYIAPESRGESGRIFVFIIVNELLLFSYYSLRFRITVSLKWTRAGVSVRSVPAGRWTMEQRVRRDCRRAVLRQTRDGVR